MSGKDTIERVGAGAPSESRSVTTHRGEAVRGLLSGLVGGLCCIAGALAVGLGLGGVSFFGTLMSRYQIYFLLASLGFMGLWVARTIQRSDTSDGRIRTLLGAAARPVTVMGLTYAVTLAVAFGAASVAGLR